MNKRFYFLMMLLLVAPWIAWGQEAVTITNADDLRKFAETVNANTDYSKTWDVSLEGDIDLGGEENPWTPIKNFSGTFDGQGFSIDGLYINFTEETNNTPTYLGLFGNSDGTIQNLKITNAHIEGTGSYIYIGGIVAFSVRGCTIANCSFDGEIKATINQNPIAAISIGGIFGVSEDSSKGKISSCFHKGNIEVSLNNLSDDYGYLGYGISGIGTIGEIENSYNEGDITVKINDVSALQVGIGGIGSSSKISSCYNIGNIKVEETGTNTITYFGVGGITGTHSVTNIQYCYNKGQITATNATTGSILGLDQTYSGHQNTFEKNYYPENETAVGGNANDPSASYDDEEGLISATREQFSNGEVAWLLRDEGGYGQELTEDGKAIDKTPVLLAFNENKEVYQLTLNLEGITEIKGEPIYRNAEECNLLPTATYDKIMEGADPGQDLVWTNEAGEVFSGNKYTVTKDETLTAKLEGVYEINKVVTPEGAGNINVKETAANGETVTFSIETNDGYEFVSISRDGQIEVDENGDGLYTFTMPANNVTITATFKKIETGDSEDEDYDGDLTKRYRLYLADQDFYQNDEYDEEGLVLYSRHDKKYTGAGGSFTIYYEKDGEMNAGDYRIFWSKSANGEYKEVKLDEVSGYYQIRNVQSDVYVKIYGRDGCPVSNEAIEATEARAYAQANKIIVVTHEPMDVQIVSMAGAVVGNAKVAGQQEFGNLAEGVYIVRLGDTVVKLQVRN